MEMTARREAGFTLLEVLFAMVIMGIGVLAIGLAQISSLKVASKSRSLAQAMYLAQEKLDLFMVLPGSDTAFTVAATNVPDPSGHLDINPDDADETTFSRSWTIEPNTPVLGMTRITVDVSWDTASGATHSIQLQGIKRL